MVNDVFVHSKTEKDSSFSEQHNETLSFVGLKNSGNTCFLAASTNLVLSITELAHLVSLKYHNYFCARKHCFLCAWETLAFEMLQKTRQDDPLSLVDVANKYATVNPFYTVGRMFDASEVVGQNIDCYEERLKHIKA